MQFWSDFQNETFHLVHGTWLCAQKRVIKLVHKKKIDFPSER